MKKGRIFTGIILLLTIGLSSCSEETKSEGEESKPEEKMDMCTCFEIQLEMSKEMEAAGDDEALFEEIEEKYKADRESCEVLGKAIQEEMEQLSDAEQEEKFMEMQDECPAMKELMGGF